MPSLASRLSLLTLLAGVPLKAITPVFEITQRETQEVALEPGMTVAELLALLGEPSEITPYVASSSLAEHWIYRQKLPPTSDTALHDRVQVVELMIFNGVLIAGKHFIEVRPTEEP